MTSVHFDDDLVVVRGGRVVVFPSGQIRPCNDIDEDESGEETEHIQWYGLVALSREDANIDVDYEPGIDLPPARGPSPPSHPRSIASDYDDTGLLAVEPLSHGHFAVAQYTLDLELLDHWELAGPTIVRRIIVGPEAFFIAGHRGHNERYLTFLRGYSRHDGERLWEWDLDTRVDLGVVDADRLYVSVDGTLYALSQETGEILEEFSLSHRSGETPSVSFIQRLGEFLYIAGHFDHFDGEHTGNFTRIRRGR